MALESGSFVYDLNTANPPGTDPKSQGDDHIRLIKLALRDSFAGFTGHILVTGTDGGAVNAYTLTPTPALIAYTPRMIALFAPTVTNTGAVTLNVSGLGVRDVRSVSGAALVGGDLTLGTIYTAAYNGTYWQLLSVSKNYIDQLAFGSALPAQPGGPIPRYLQSIDNVASFGPHRMVEEERAANTMLVASDSGKIIELTGTFAQTFDAAANLGLGWYVDLRNASALDTDENTLTPNGAETIDERTSFKMYKGETRRIYRNAAGTGLKSFVISEFDVAVTANLTFTKPPGYAYFAGELYSGGNSGQRTNNASTLSLGGGGSGVLDFLLPASKFANTENMVIGQGGAAVTTVANGNAGTATSIGSIVSISPNPSFSNGGSVVSGLTHAFGTTNLPPVGYEGGRAVTPGTSDSGIDAIKGGGGSSSGASSARSGNSIFGAAAGGSLTSAAVVVVPGTSIHAGNGGAALSAANGSPGVAPGGGGGATQTGAQSGAGARGEIRIRGVV